MIRLGPTQNKNSIYVSFLNLQHSEWTFAKLSYTSLISSYKPARSLRSSDHLLLQVPNREQFNLPKSLKKSETVTIFEKKLKTFLFCHYFNS